MRYEVIKGVKCSDMCYDVGFRYFTHGDINKAYIDYERLYNEWNCGCKPDIREVKDV